jgi:hypothetical protein
MDRNAEKLLKEIKKYVRSAAAYEKAKAQLHKKQSREMGLSNSTMQKQLKLLGIDVKPLLEESAALEKKLPTVHKNFLAFQKPPLLPGNFVIFEPPDPNVISIVPPAIDGFGGGYFSDADCGFNLALGETNFQVSYQGGNWGWDGGPSGLFHYSTLVFSFAPPKPGNILVEPYIDFKGSYAISAHDHWYSSTEATFRLRASSRLYQHYWENGPFITLIDEDFTDSSDSGWITTVEKLSYTTSVSANDTVLIFIEIELVAGARSGDARTDVDFKTGAERRIKVPVIQMRYF